MQFQYVADAGEAFVRASEAVVPGASVHNLDGPVASVPDVIAAIEKAAPEARAASPQEDPLPFPSSVDPPPSSSSSAARPRGRSTRAWPRRSRRSAEHGAVRGGADRRGVAGEDAAREPRRRRAPRRQPPLELILRPARPRAARRRRRPSRRRRPRPPRSARRARPPARRGRPSARASRPRSARP